MQLNMEKLKKDKPADRRQFKRFFVSPKFQLQYGTYYWAVAMTVLSIWTVLAVYFMMALMTFDPRVAHDMSLPEYLKVNIKAHQWLFAGGFAASSFLFLTLAVVFTERIVGPMRALLRHIEALEAGNYEHKTNLRKGDELKPMMTALNKLSDTLKERHGAPHDLSKTGS